MGLFKAADGRLINADLNSALNMIRKVILNAFAERIEAVIVPPVRAIVA